MTQEGCCSCHINPPCDDCMSKTYCNTCNKLKNSHDMIEVDDGYICDERCDPKSKVKVTQSLIPFNLERALAGDPVVTRDRRKVIRTNCTDIDVRRPVVVLIEYDDRLTAYTLTGCYRVDGREDNYDLFMAPKIKTYWVNIWLGKNTGDIYSAVYNDQEKANKELTDQEYRRIIKQLSFEVEE